MTVNRKAHPKPSCLIAISILTLLLFYAGAAVAIAAEAVGTVTHLNGPLFARKQDKSIKTLAIKSVVEVGDTLMTEKKTYARIKFIDGGELTLRPQSQLIIDAYVFDMFNPPEDKAVFSAVKGGLRAVTGQIGRRFRSENYRLNTPTATIGVRGTVFEVRICEGNCAGIANGLYLFVPEGSITVQNNIGMQQVGAGQYAYVKDTQTRPVILPANPGLTFTLPETFQQKSKPQGGCVMR